jgi:hypothetical protein
MSDDSDIEYENEFQQPIEDNFFEFKKEDDEASISSSIKSDFSQVDLDLQAGFNDVLRTEKQTKQEEKEMKMGLNIDMVTNYLLQYSTNVLKCNKIIWKYEKKIKYFHNPTLSATINKKFGTKFYPKEYRYFRFLELIKKSL